MAPNLLPNQPFIIPSSRTDILTGLEKNPDIIHYRPCEQRTECENPHTWEQALPGCLERGAAEELSFPSAGAGSILPLWKGGLVSLRPELAAYGHRGYFFAKC